MTMFDGGHSEYTSGKLDFPDLLADPIEQLRLWLQDATNAKVIEPMAMTLATVSAGGLPSARMVLLRGLDEGVVFYTNYLSRKGMELGENPHAALCFWWGVLERQVRVEGRVAKVPTEESDAYFASRPKDSQAASAISPQSQIVDDRKELEQAMREMQEQSTIERPDHWGGYRLIPTYVEFWQGRKARLHDRFAYIRQGDGWNIHRLAP
ncbi:MAG: pyridoxamine 5'-phosphate oxidase [Armatimonadetes bacterium]|nr:pyridoxamine 5'-phosphate oxidase [Armatimonadota bacterium]MBS1725976.1 pyridoxamine 5'-phosphate oxidase [Armatimonadota bacterium]